MKRFTHYGVSRLILIVSVAIFFGLSATAQAADNQYEVQSAPLDYTVREVVSDHLGNPRLLLSSDGRVYNTQTNQMLGQYVIKENQTVDLLEDGFVVRTTEYQDESREILQRITWTVYDTTGENIFTLDKPIDIDQPLPFVASPAGAHRFLLIDPWELTLSWYNRTGLIKEHPIEEPDILHTYEIALLAEWDPSGQYGIVAVASPKISGKQPVMLFDGAGELLWQQQFPVQYIDGVVAVNQSRFVVAGHDYVSGEFDKKYFVIDQFGKILQTGTGIATGAYFTPQDGGIVWGRRFVEFYGDISDPAHWRKEFPDDRRSLCLSGTFTGEDRVALLRGTSTPANGEYHFTRPQVLFFSHEGEEKYTRTFTNEAIVTPLLQYFPAQKQVTLFTHSRQWNIRIR